MPGFQTSAGSPASEKPRPASGRANRRRPRPCSCTGRCRHPRVLRRKRARARHTDHTREASPPGTRRRGPGALVRATFELVRFEPTRGPPLRMEASPLGSHLPGKEGGILKETSMILLTPQHQVCPAPRNFASCCFMHATAVRSTNQQPPDGERARDTAQNRVPWVARCEPIRYVPLPAPSGSAPQTHGLRRRL